MHNMSFLKAFPSYLSPCLSSPSWEKKDHILQIENLLEDLILNIDIDVNEVNQQL